MSFWGDAKKLSGITSDGSNPVKSFKRSWTGATNGDLEQMFDPNRAVPKIKQLANEGFRDKDTNNDAALEQQKQLKEALAAKIAERPAFQGGLEGDVLADKYLIKPGPYSSILPELKAQQDAIGDVNSGQDFLNARSGVSNLQSQADLQGLSKWGDANQNYQDVLNIDARQLAERDAVRSRENAYSQMAMRGGLDSGARERLFESSDNNRMEALQRQSRANQLASLGIVSEDEGRKFDLSKNLPGMNLELDQYQTGLAENNRGAAFKKTNDWATVADAESGRVYTANNNAATNNARNTLDTLGRKNTHDLDRWRAEIRQTAANGVGDQYMGG